MAFTHEEVAHLNHILELAPAATTTGQVIAAFTTTGNVFSTGNLAVTASSFAHSPWTRMQIIPSLDDDCQPRWPGASLIYATGYNAVTSGTYQAPQKIWFVSSRAAGQQVKYETTGTFSSWDLASWTIVPRYVSVNGTLTWCVTIFSGESTLCVTAGSSPSNSAPSDNTQLFLTDYDGSYNQLFILKAPHCFSGGVYGMIPSYDWTFDAERAGLSMGPYAGALTAGLGIKLHADSSFSRGQTWKIVHRGCLQGSTTTAQHRALFYYPRARKNDRSMGTTDSNILVTAGAVADGVGTKQIRNTGIIQNQPAMSSPSILTDDGLFVENYTQYDSDTWLGQGDWWYGSLTHSTFQLLASPSVGLSDAELWAAEEKPPAYPTTPSSDVTIEDQANGFGRWCPTPRNFYDRSLSVPQMLRLVDAYGNEIGDTRYLNSGSTLKIFPQAICGEDQVLTMVQIRRRLDDGTWGEWGIAESPDGEVTAKLAGGVPLPYQTSTRLPAWIPNAWLGDPDQEGRRTQTQGYVITGHDYEVQVRVSMRSFAYGMTRLTTDTTSMEVEPFVGDAAVTTLTIAPRPAIAFSDGTVDREGFHIPYAISRMTTPVSVHISHLLWSNSQMWTNTVPDYVIDFETTLSTASGTIDIPWTAASLLPASFASLSYSYAKIAGTLGTSIGVETFERSIQLSHSLSEMNITTTDTSIYQRLTAPTIFGTLTVITHAYAQIDSEMGPRVIKLDNLKQNEILWPVTASPDFNASPNGYATSQRIMLFSGSQCEVLTPPKKPSWQHIPSLTWMTHDLFDVAHIILLRGDPEYTTTLTKDSTITRRWNSSWKDVEVASGVAQDTRMTATLYSGQTSMTGLSIVDSDISILHSTRDLAGIPADTSMLLQTSYGVTKIVKLVAVDVPRSQRDRADVTLTLEEVESL